MATPASSRANAAIRPIVVANNAEASGKFDVEASKYLALAVKLEVAAQTAVPCHKKRCVALTANVEVSGSVAIICR